MSQTHAHPPRKMKSTEKQGSVPPAIDAAAAVPAPEDGDHALSHAAHLDEAQHAHTKPEGALLHGLAPGRSDQQAQRATRTGKEHRNR